MPGEIETIVKSFMCDNFIYDQGVESLSESDSFLESGLIDSTGMLQLITFIESTFSIQIGLNEVLPENLDSIVRVAAFVRRKLAFQEAVISQAS